jgi:hypothetical protein
MIVTQQTDEPEPIRNSVSEFYCISISGQEQKTTPVVCMNIFKDVISRTLLSLLKKVSYSDAQNVEYSNGTLALLTKNHNDVLNGQNVKTKGNGQDKQDNYISHCFYG